MRLVLEQQRSQREASQSLGLSQSTVAEYLSRFAASGLTWQLAADVDDGTLEARLFRRQALPATAERPDDPRMRITKDAADRRTWPKAREPV